MVLTLVGEVVYSNTDTPDGLRTRYQSYLTRSDGGIHIVVCIRI